MEIKTDIYLGDSKEVLKQIPDNSVNLIFTSPPCVDRRKKTYGGIQAIGISAFNSLIANVKVGKIDYNKQHAFTKINFKNVV